jgi:adenylylsulfate kinase-like enzyme
VNTPINVCRQRDTEGLYEKAEKGEIQHFSGVSSDYEPPGKPDLVIDNGNLSVVEAVDLIVANIQAKLVNQ